MVTKDLQIAKRLINKLINETIARWSQKPYGKVYIIQHAEPSQAADDTIVIRPTHSGCFYGIEDYIHVAEACGCSFYIDCTENEDGILTPTLHIH